MDNHVTHRVSGDALLGVPRLELTLVLLAWGLGAVLALTGMALVQPEAIVPLSILISGAILLNLVLLWLDRRGAEPSAIDWMARLGNLAFLTGGLALTGGFLSPFFCLYAIYLVAVSLRHGWRGALISYGLFLVSWAILALVQPPQGRQAWIWVGLLAAAFFVITLAVGGLSYRQIRFWSEARQRNREMAFLREAGRSLASSLDPQDVLAETLARANEVLDVDAASLALVDSETGHIIFALAIGGANDRIEGLQLEPGQGIVGHVIEEGRSHRIPNVDADGRWYSGVDAESGYETQSILCVPLRVQRQVIGALEVLNKRDGPFTEQDQRLLESLADLSAQAIQNARLHEELQSNSWRLQEAYVQVRELDELKTAFIRNVSHELRTPLALVQGYLELLLDGQMGPLQPNQQESLAMVAAKAAKVTALVNDMLSLQAVGAVHYDFEVLSLVSVVRASVQDVTAKAERTGVQLELDLPAAGALPMVQGDAKRLRRALGHLLDNAIKFSQAAGAVRLSLAYQHGMLFLKVRDGGVGLAEDQLERIFERFYQVDGSSTRSHGGAGLGLAQVKEVIEAHGGAVWADSEGLGLGSTFTLFLPIHEGQVQDQGTTEPKRT